jgi:hypothetical protein
VRIKIFLATLNRLCGRDDLSKKVNLLRYLTKEIKPDKISKLLLQTESQLKKLLNFKMKYDKVDKKYLLNPLVFYVTDIQKEKIEKAILRLSEQVKCEKTKASKRSAALTVLAEFFLDHSKN